MEKTLRRLVISPRPFTDSQIAERERLADFISIPGVVRVVNEYRHDPDILKKVKLEKDSGGMGLDEHSIRDAINEPSYHNVHLFLTTVEWRNLGIRMSLYGQSQEIDGQGITYGRKGTHLRYYTQDVKDALNDITLVEWHELDHTLRALWDVDAPTTHYHFYGYAGQYKDVPKNVLNQIKPRRWVRKPDPVEGWKALPWHRLDEVPNTPPTTDPVKQSLIAALLQLVALLQKQLNEKLANKPKLVKPLKTWGENVSYAYGEYNPSLYPLTKHHIGVDHATPKGTPIYAPGDGHVVAAGYNNTLGHWISYQYADNRTLVALHLENHPKLEDIGAPVKAGAQIGVVGDTGFIIGVHSHIEVWTIPVRRDTLPVDMAEKWRDYTRDPLKEF